MNLATESEIPTTVRAEWRRYFRARMPELSTRAIHAATDAALEALLEGYPAGAAVAAGIATSLPSVEMHAPIASTNLYLARVGPEVPLAHPVSDETSLQGVVSGAGQRIEMDGSGKWVCVVEFQLDHWDQNGAVQPSVGIEMRGGSYDGNISNGDWVRIPTEWQPAALHRISEVENLTTNGRLVVTSPAGRLATVSSARPVAVRPGSGSVQIRPSGSARFRVKPRRWPRIVGVAVCALVLLALVWFR